MRDRTTRTIRKQLKTARRLPLAPVLLVAALAVVLSILIDARGKERAAALVADAAERQRVLHRRHADEVLLASLGLPAEPEVAADVAGRSLEVLIEGGSSPAAEGEGDPAPPLGAAHGSFREKLLEQRELFERLREESVVALPAGTKAPPPERIQVLIERSRSVDRAAAAAAAAQSEESRRERERRDLWQVGIGIASCILGVGLVVMLLRWTRLSTELGVEVAERRKAERELREMSAALEEDIVERKEAEEALARANRDLEGARDELEARVSLRTAALSRANQDLETLLHVISHDLKEPLRAIENFTQLLWERQRERLDPKGQDFLQRVLRAGERMRRLLGDILQLSRVRKMDSPSEEVRGEAVVREALARLDGRIRETGASVKVGREFPRLLVEKTWATEAVYNLLSNALKFTQNGEAPEVEIAPYRPRENEPSGVGIAVLDRGPGVPADQADKIFELFQRGVGREVEGTGAGLAIVREVAEKHGGRAWVRSREGGGSEFVITFAQPAEGGKT